MKPQFSNMWLWIYTSQLGKMFREITLWITNSLQPLLCSFLRSRNIWLCFTTSSTSDFLRNVPLTIVHPPIIIMLPNLRFTKFMFSHSTCTLNRFNKWPKAKGTEYRCRNEKQLFIEKAMMQLFIEIRETTRSNKQLQPFSIH